MAEVDVARVGRVADETADYRAVANELSGLGQAYQTNRAETQIDEAAQDISSFAAATRDAAGAYDPTASPQARLQAASLQDPNVILRERANEIGADASRRFERYRRAVEQGASNKSAARIAMQKEMRDMISASPGYADVIRRAAARAMDEEEFIVMTSDLPKNTGELTEFQKFQADVSARKSTLMRLEGWTQNQADNWEEQQLRTKLKADENTLQLELISGMDQGNGRVATQKARILATQTDIRVDEIVDTVSLRVAQGATFSPEETRQIVTELDNLILDTERQMRDAFLTVPNISPSTIEQEISNGTANLRAVRAAVVENRFDKVAAIRNEAIKNNQSLTFAELMPLESAIVNVFGESNLRYYAGVLTNKDDPMFQQIFRNSPYFSSTRARLGSMGMTPEQQHSFFVQEVTDSLDRWKSGAADQRDMQAVAGAAGAAGARSVPQRNEDGFQEELFSVNSLSQNAEARQIGAAQIRAANGIDDHQFNAVKQYYLPAWNGELASVKASPTFGEERFFQVETGDDGLPVIMRYTRIGEVTGNPETSPQIRRAREEGLTMRYRDLFMREQTARGPRSVAEKPRISEELFGAKPVGLVVSEYMADLNGSTTVPSWAPRPSTRQVDIDVHFVGVDEWGGPTTLLGRTLTGRVLAGARGELEQITQNAQASADRRRAAFQAQRGTVNE